MCVLSSLTTPPISGTDPEVGSSSTKLPKCIVQSSSNKNGCLFSILYVFPITGPSLVKWSFSLLFSQAQQRSSPSCCCENASLFSSVHVWNLSCKQTPESIRSGPNEMICWPTSLPVCTQCTLTDSENLDTFKL